MNTSDAPSPFSEDALLAVIAQKMSDAIVVHELGGAIRIWNKGAESLFGYPRAAALGFDMQSLIAPADREAYAEHLAQLTPGVNSAALEIRVLTNDGLHSDLQLTASLLAVDAEQEPAVVAIFRDISAQKSIENKLVALIESTPDPFIIVEADGRIQRVNRQAEILFGYGRQELIGQSYKMLVPARFRSQHDLYTHNYQTRPVMRQMGIGLELCCLTRAGEEIPVEIGLSPVVTQGETISWCVFATSANKSGNRRYCSRRDSAPMKPTAPSPASSPRPVTTCGSPCSRSA
jgi:PAS domain S-box-containing protein